MLTAWNSTKKNGEKPEEEMPHEYQLLAGAQCLNYELMKSHLCIWLDRFSKYKRLRFGK